MIKLPKLALLGLLLLILSSPTLAQEPIAKCNGGSCEFKNLRKPLPNEDALGNPNGAFYYCVAPDNAAAVVMLNYHVLITGFNGKGQLQSTLPDLDRHFFIAYKDKNDRGNVFVMAGSRVETDDTLNVTCFSGKGEGRTRNADANTAR